MKKNSKYLSIFLAIIMVVTMIPFSIIGANAVSVPAISLDSNKDIANVGDVVTLTVKTTENSKIVIVSGIISFDSDYFEVIPDSKTYPQGALCEINTKTAGKVKFAYVSVAPLADSETNVLSIDFKVLKTNGVIDLDVKEVYVLDGNTEVDVSKQAGASVQPLTIACNHSYNLSSTTNATCTVDGVKKYVCSECEDVYEETIPALGHTKVTVDAKNPTCTEAGYEAYEYCSVCDYTTFKEISATGHIESYPMRDVNAYAPTCTEDGLNAWFTICETCGETLNRGEEPIPAKGHTEGNMVTENTVDATCTDEGSYENVVYCTECGEDVIREKVAIPAIGHSYNAVVTAPTCTVAGYTTYTCHCGDSYVADETPAKGHTPDDMIVENTSNATCGTPGSYDEVVKCAVCGFEISRETKTTETLPHAYTSEITTAPTCTETGVKTFTCSVCGEAYTETVNATGHTIVTVDAKNPTCTEIGNEAYEYCSVCDYTTYEEIPATGHSYNAVVTAPTCTKQGFTTYICACGETYIDDYVDANGHTPSNSIEENYVAPTCTEDGSKDVVVYCSVCDDEISRETEILDATGHADNDGDGYCDADNELLDPSVECECNCHKTGISNFFFKLILFFQKLFGSNKVCACGIAHY